MMTQLSHGVTVATAELYTTTTTAIQGPRGECLLIDPAVTPADLESLAALVRPTMGFATHAHWDHLLWSRSLGPSIQRYASARTVASAGDPALIPHLNREAPGHDHSLFGRLTPVPDDVLPWSGPEARVITHDAHEPGHSALFFPSSGVLVAGDMLSDIEMPLLDMSAPDPAGDYRRGLSLLGGLGGVRWVIPGHGHPGDAAEFRRRLDLDLRYLDSPAWGDPRLENAPAWLRQAHDNQLRVLAGLGSARAHLAVISAGWTCGSTLQSNCPSDA
jgi:hydroxyacylglutathione hydrolase